MTQPIVVQKYGGSSVATPELLMRVAEIIVARRRQGFGVVVVVSAMGDTTDNLLRLAKSVAEEPDRRELDMLLSAGERISMSLLAMAIRERGERAVSLTGSQSGIITTASHTNARIMEVRPFRVQDELEAGHIVIVAGYQGVSYRRDVTTLGRGGSDTTAVALAAALGATACEIYSDVEGVFTADPRVVPSAAKLEEIGYQEMQELATHGAKVLNETAVEFAKQKNIAIYARRTGSGDPGTVIRLDVPTPPSGVRGIAHEKAVATVEARSVSSGKLSSVLKRLEDLGAWPKQLHHGDDGFSCVLSLGDVHNLRSLAQDVETILGPGSIRTDSGAISLIGEGITRETGRVLLALEALARDNIQVRSLSTSSFRITLLVPQAQVERAVNLLHEEFRLGRPSVEAQIP